MLGYKSKEISAEPGLTPGHSLEGAGSGLEGAFRGSLGQALLPSAGESLLPAFEVINIGTPP